LPTPDMPSKVMALCGQARKSERFMRIVDEPGN
jgi:hypothetical protein